MSRHLLIPALCCGAIALSVGACQEDKPASGENKATPSAAEPTATTVDKAEKAGGPSQPAKTRKTRSREQSESTASDGSDERAGRGQTSAGTTAAERKATAEAVRRARSGTEARDAPSNDSSQVRDGEARDDWALYQQRKKNDSAK